MTERQRAVLDSITQSLEQRGYPPSMREIAQATGLASTSSVAHQLRSLERGGLLHHDPQRPRAYVPVGWPHRSHQPQPEPHRPEPLQPEPLLPEPSQSARQQDAAPVAWVPLIDQTDAGAPHPVEPQALLPLPQDILGQGEFFALRMADSSMTDAGIHQGDILSIRRQDTAEHDDLVAARAHQQTVIRRLRCEHGQVRLTASSMGHAPIHGARAVVLGKVIAVLRYGL
ncbi:transcriptional repressor LexA [Streptomyces sp. MZ04]|uniref:transcriptional repressor LexA n=1 Tax=Streptomyces sp. MZ04 TaxID=2559236 RepID=UPI001432B168|nr:transcriptional repressor LexA [Streptomyces sp. MZ04]